MFSALGEKDLTFQKLNYSLTKTESVTQGIRYLWSENSPDGLKTMQTYFSSHTKWQFRGFLGLTDGTDKKFQSFLGLEHLSMNWIKPLKEILSSEKPNTNKPSLKSLKEGSLNSSSPRHSLLQKAPLSICSWEIWTSWDFNSTSWEPSIYIAYQIFTLNLVAKA